MLTHSFAEHDVQVLLQPVAPVFLSIEEKEAQIQSGTHYSRILSKESAPQPEYLDLFDAQVESFGAELANDMVKLAGMIVATRDKPVIVSLVRAGTPVGVILRRIMAHEGIDAPHFTVSIVRDRGLDMRAIGHILDQGHAGQDIAFVDGWTGKGVIRRELSKSLTEAGPRFEGIPDELFVVGDIAGVADYAATRQDTLIPSCLLNATVSGLISRSVTCDDIGADQHGATFLDNLSGFDRSLAFVNRISELAIEILKSSNCSLKQWGVKSLGKNLARKNAAQDMQSLILRLQDEFAISDVNKIKPGIGESSRVLLRRVPEMLLVSSLECEAVKHLLVLAKERNVPVKIYPEMSINAVAMIKDVGHE